MGATISSDEEISDFVCDKCVDLEKKDKDLNVQRAKLNKEKSEFKIEKS